ncbi:MAG: hypothetical protein OEV85_10395 [Candidatus Thorarchaeota archaeon]|nr:hypothetical protein [Candidatus Thorarchaeota archaeon]
MTGLRTISDGCANITTPYTSEWLLEEERRSRTSVPWGIGSSRYLSIIVVRR